MELSFKVALNYKNCEGDYEEIIRFLICQKVCRTDTLPLSPMFNMRCK